MTERIQTIRHDDGVVELHLVREDKMNALDSAMFDALITHGEQLREDRSVRAVVRAKGQLLRSYDWLEAKLSALEK